MNARTVFVVTFVTLYTRNYFDSLILVITIETKGLL